MLVNLIIVIIILSNILGLLLLISNVSHTYGMSEGTLGQVGEYISFGMSNVVNLHGFI